MSSIEQKEEPDYATVEAASSSDIHDESSAYYRKMTRRVLLKFDIHILPPLALVSYLSFLLSILYSN